MMLGELEHILLSLGEKLEREEVDILIKVGYYTYLQYVNELISIIINIKIYIYDIVNAKSVFIKK